MEMTSHPFVPFFKIFENGGRSKTFAKKSSDAGKSENQNFYADKKKIQFDVEMMVDIIMSTEPEDGGKTHAQVLADVIEAVHPGSVDWAALCPFRTTRLS